MSNFAVNSGINPLTLELTGYTGINQLNTVYTGVLSWNPQTHNIRGEMNVLLTLREVPVARLTGWESHQPDGITPVNHKPPKSLL